MNRTAEGQMNRLGRHRFGQLFRRIFLITFATLVIILAFSQSCLYIQTRYLLDAELDKGNFHQLSQVQEALDGVRRNAENTMLRMAVDSDIRAFMKSKLADRGSYQDVETRIKIKEKMNGWMANMPFDSLLVYARETDAVLCSEYGSGMLAHYPDQKAIVLADQVDWAASKIAYVLRERVPLLIANNIPCLTLIMRVEIPGQRQNYALLNLRLETLQALIAEKSADPLSDILMIDREGRVLLDSSGQWSDGDVESLRLSPEKNEKIMSASSGAFNAEIAGRLMRISWMHSGFDEMRYLQIVPYNHYATLLDHLVHTTLITLGIGTLVVLAASWVLARYAHRPIRLITQAMDDPSPVDSSVNLDEETRYILMKLLLANGKNTELEEENLRQFEALRRAQANVLQAQMTPHFLYNALQSIQMMILMETGNTKSPAAEAVLVLSSIMRSILQKGIDTVCLSEEICYLEKYIYLKKLSYPDKLDVRLEVPPALGGYSVPKLCLQPLLENVILHGMPDHVPCQVVIRAEETEDRLMISIEDNGPGMDEAQMEAMNQRSNEDVIFRNQHVGLINLAQRLKLLYGDQAWLHLSKGALGGLRVVFFLPKSLSENGVTPG